MPRLVLGKAAAYSTPDLTGTEHSPGYASQRVTGRQRHAFASIQPGRSARVGNCKAISRAASHTRDPGAGLVRPRVTIPENLPDRGVSFIGLREQTDDHERHGGRKNPGHRSKPDQFYRYDPDRRGDIMSEPGSVDRTGGPRSRVAMIAFLLAQPRRALARWRRWAWSSIYRLTELFAVPPEVTPRLGHPSDL